MATELEKKWIKTMREAEEAHSDFERAICFELLYDGLEESSFKSLLDRAGFDYRTARYLVGIMEDADRLSYPREDIQKLMTEIGWTKASIILKSLTRRRSVDNLIRQYGRKTVPELHREFPSPNAKRNHSAKRQFSAFLSERDHTKLLRVLRSRYGLVDSGGKRKDVSKAFAQLVNDL